MTGYRTVWLTTCVVLGLSGAAVALAAWPSTVAFLFVVLGVVGGLVTFCLGDAYWEQTTLGRLRLLVCGALAPSIGIAAFAGYASLLGPGVLLLAAAILAGSPYTVNISKRLLRAVRTPSAAQLDAVARAFADISHESADSGSSNLRNLTDERLCKRWRASYRASQRRSSAGQLIAGVAERRAYLDELERRNRGGFAAWLAAGPQAAEDPLPYLTSDHIDAPALDWDQLTRGQGQSPSD